MFMAWMEASAQILDLANLIFLFGSSSNYAK